ncbi:unnamed protein product, partial [Choristocarpus tenellus]
MILSIMENCGNGFRSGEKFVLAVRHYLCDALLLNCTSSNRTVAELSLKIFKPMCRDFKVHLKSEIEVFITNVFLRVLESENSTFEHKKHVLELVTSFSHTPRGLVEMFLNYDCDLHAVDLFNRIMHTLSKVSKGRRLSALDVSNNPNSLKEENYLRTKGLEALIDILHNMLRCVASDAREVDQGLPGVYENLEGKEDGVGEAGSGGGSDVGVDSSVVMVDSNGDITKEGEGGGGGGLMSPVSVVQEYDRKKRLTGDLENGFVRFNISPSK